MQRKPTTLLADFGSSCAAAPAAMPLSMSHRGMEVIRTRDASRKSLSCTNFANRYAMPPIGNDSWVFRHETLSKHMLNDAVQQMFTGKVSKHLQLVQIELLNKSRTKHAHCMPGICASSWTLPNAE